jgi:hypothetical protein
LARGGSSNQSSANVASRGGRGGTGGRRGGGRGSSGGRGRGFGGRGRGNNTGGSKLRFNGKCQVCFKECHSALSC